VDVTLCKPFLTYLSVTGFWDVSLPPVGARGQRADAATRRATAALRLTAAVGYSLTWRFIVACIYTTALPYRLLACVTNKLVWTSWRAGSSILVAGCHNLSAMPGVRYMATLPAAAYLHAIFALQTSTWFFRLCASYYL